MRSFSIFLLLLGCSHQAMEKTGLNNFKEEKFYNYEDLSGRYQVKKQAVLSRPSGRLVTISKMKTLEGKFDRPIERSTLVAGLGNMQNHFLIRPSKSVFEIWLNNKSLKSITKVDEKSRSIVVEYTDPNSNKNVSERFNFPKTTGYFCYVGQIPECLRALGLIERFNSLPQKRIPITLIWEQYPYHSLIYEGISKDLFVSAIITLDELDKDNTLKLTVEIEEQYLHFHLRSNYQVDSFFWVQQGIKKTLL